VSGFYVMQRDACCYHSASLEDAIDWATRTAPRKPPRGYRWDIWSSDGERVAIVRFAPLPAVEYVIEDTRPMPRLEVSP
jgi:hypothetical protein